MSFHPDLYHRPNVGWCLRAVHACYFLNESQDLVLLAEWALVYAVQNEVSLLLNRKNHF